MCTQGWNATHGGWHACHRCGTFGEARIGNPFWRRWISSTTSNRTLCDPCADREFTEIEEREAA